MDFLTFLMGTGETREIFLVLHRPKAEISHKITHTASLEVIKPIILLSADLTINPQLVLRPMNKNICRTLIRHRLTWFVSLQPMIP